MYHTICYLGFSARDFTEISAARKRLTPSAELRFFTAAVDLLDHVNYSLGRPTIVFLDTRVLDSEWELVRRLEDAGAGTNLRVALVSLDCNTTERKKAQACGITAY